MEDIKQILDAVPTGLPDPDITVDETEGEILVEYCIHSRKLVTLSIGPTLISWAALLGENSFHGSFPRTDKMHRNLYMCLEKLKTEGSD